MTQVRKHLKAEFEKLLLEGTARVSSEVCVCIAVSLCMALFLMCICTCLGCAVLLILGSCAFTVSYIDATYVYIMYTYIGGCLS